jgi:TetR/AcrR family transcriptional regulator of autoinduction and epiphytic fitness
MVNRSYNSPRREQQARETRAAVIAAAHRLFVANGYAATSLREVAEEAQVGEQTVYRVFGNKPGLMRAVILSAVSGDVEGTAGRDMEEFMRDVTSARSPLEAVRVIGAWSGATYERGAAELEEVVFAAAQADPRLEDLAAFVRDERYKDVKALVATVVAETGPPPGMTIDDMADYIYAVWSGPVYRQLVKERGWTLEKYIQWCVLMAQRMFLDQ